MLRSSKEGLKDEEFKRREGEIRAVLSEVMRDRFLSDDPENARREMALYEEAHDWLHDQVNGLMHQAAESFMAGDYVKGTDSALSLRYLTILHFGVEYFELLVLDHLRRLDDEELQKSDD